MRKNVKMKSQEKGECVMKYLDRYLWYDKTRAALELVCASDGILSRVHVYFTWLNFIGRFDMRFISGWFKESFPIKLVGWSLLVANIGYFYQENV